jgi:hypothetical protein
MFRLLSEQVARSESKPIDPGTKEKAGPSRRRSGLESFGFPFPGNLAFYLLLPTLAGAGACLEAQAPRVRVAAARATTATILVMVVMVIFRLLSLLVAYLRNRVTAIRPMTKKNQTW